MYRKIYSYITIIALTLVATITSCSGGNGGSIEGDVQEFTHARLLKVTGCDGYTVADIRNPWAKDSASALLHRYILVPRDVEMPASLPEGQVVRTPIERAAVFTSVHASLLEQLGAYDAIRGVADLQYMYLDRIRDDVQKGKIVDCGIADNPTIERVIDLAPEAIVISPFENSGSYGRLGKLNIAIIEAADYMESDALGRAEWMRFYGMLFGRQTTADSLFSAIETEYDSLKALVADAVVKPTVVTEKKYGAQWFVAGANSVVGRLLRDAGADYIFNDEKASGSVPYSPEKVFDRAHEADVWLIKYGQDTPLTYQQLASEWGNYARMKSFTTQRIYGCNLSKVPFYEETPFHPQLLLRDYINIFHPEILNDKTLRYYHPLDSAAGTPAAGDK